MAGISTANASKEGTMRRTARWVAILATGMIMAIPAGLRADDDDDITSKLPRPDSRPPRADARDRRPGRETSTTPSTSAAKASILDHPARRDRDRAERTQIPDLFPKGSTDPNSRALPAIWEKWDEFVKLAKQLEDQAQKLSAAAGAEDDEDLKASRRRCSVPARAATTSSASRRTRRRSKPVHHREHREALWSLW
jgi:hypothetical protein